MPITAPDPIEPLLFSLARRERLARDRGDWDGLTDAYWPDGVVRVTWFTGSPAGFAEASQRQYRPSERAGTHTIHPVRSEVEGDRAIVESTGQILLRPTVEGVDCDLTATTRFFSRFERRGSEWRMLTFDAIYLKDRIDPLVPAATVPFDAELLAAGRASYRWLTYTNVRRGMTVPDDLPGGDRPDLLEGFYSDADTWLHAARG